MISVFCKFYENLNASSLAELNTVYTQNVRFIDPVGEHNGLEALHSYFDNLLENCTTCHFTLHQTQLVEQHGFVTWTMAFSHPKLINGKTLCLEGCSEIRFSADQKVCFQRDYYDLGAMLYEHLPVLGPAIKWLKRRLNQ
ncbi:nuclear transport factor 2 family protein [Lacimicrobium alkaliphilum]|uniref:Transcriptional regulator n=1 Tax=Lacimicrobium alkaliphilum TaxID=1526571 RepID=A0ABQ1RF29_9ALTE|nr:nuclear transport factor 2 family protein [Lacimicrobium alkaliphilum]GGD66270.1 transcriptional regulator [Lacimicrobium alkaliphilum]